MYAYDTVGTALAAATGVVEAAAGAQAPSVRAHVSCHCAAAGLARSDCARELLLLKDERMRRQPAEQAARN